MTTPLPLDGTDELVCTQWIATIPGFTRTMVGTTLPPDVNADGTPALWVATGFVTVAVAGGGPDPELPVNWPVMQIDCWATVPGSNKPPWNQAAALAGAIRRATWDRRNISRPLQITANGIAYPAAAVRTAYMPTAFRRIYDDQGDYARLQADLALSWVTVNDRLY
ncbi:hypothetical protein [Kitasatospora sp. NPDC086791]|uniref:hypothetical protein n=1 Tax=Kitasatospora sp. NPDC086791 TaxID=3155178 RepID=UPI003437F30C